MATKAVLLQTLLAETSPIRAKELSEKLGEAIGNFQHTMDKLVKVGIVSKNEGKEYFIDDAKREAAQNALQEAEGGDLSPDEGEPPGQPPEPNQPPKAPELSEEKAGTTEFQIFRKYGLQVGGIQQATATMITEHIFDGGAWDDMAWVWKGLTEMGIRSDLAKRWFNRWRSHLNVGIPPELADVMHEYRTGEDGADSKEPKKRGKARLTHIINEDNLPVYMGDGQGDMTEEDAVSLAKMRTARSTKAAAGPSNGDSSLEQLSGILKLFREILVTDGSGRGKTFIVKTGESGLPELEEHAPGEPVLVTPPSGPTPSSTIYVNEAGEQTEVPAGKALIIIKEKAPAVGQGNNVVTRLVDKQTGQVTEVPAGQSIVILQSPPPQAPQAGSTDPLNQPVQLLGEDGKPMTMNFKLLQGMTDWQDKRKRDQETHELKVDLFKGIKGFVTSATKAAERMGGEKV